MFFHKNGKNEAGHPEEGDGLYPVLFVMNSLKDYHTALVNKEVDSLKELGMISNSFDSVLSEAGSFQNKLQEFGQNFSSIEQVSGELDRKSTRLNSSHIH